LSAITVGRAQGLIYAPFTGMMGQMKSNTRKPTDHQEKLAQALKRNVARRKAAGQRSSTATTQNTTAGGGWAAHHSDGGKPSPFKSEA
jgi:hypothetical protein